MTESPHERDAVRHGEGASETKKSIETGTIGLKSEAPFGDEKVQIMVLSCPVDHQGNSVHVKGWVKTDSDKPPVVLIHDFGEHVGNYRPAARQLLAAGFSVYGFDLRGHGLSGPNLGHIPTFAALVNDLLQVVAWIRYKSNRRVPFLIGQGIGALMAVYFQRAYPSMTQGAVLAAPYLRVNAYTSPLKRVVIKALAETLPKMRLLDMLTPAFLSHYTAVYAGSHETRSPTYFHGVTANFANEILQAIYQAPHEFLQMVNPALILCPELDSICDYSRLRDLVSQHSRPELFEIRSIPNSGHHLFTEEEHGLNLAMSHIIPWLNRDLSPRHEETHDLRPTPEASHSAEAAV
jgi:alpha-beta hydrolase superfamily lysophospholipase